MSNLDPRALRDAFGTFMTGVTVVTTCDATGAPLGFTANSFSSVSLAPPLVSVCLAKSSQNYATFAEAKCFAVNVLAETQIEISNTFARPVEDRFAQVRFQESDLGTPLLDGVSAWFDCKMHETVEAGDHLILIGEVTAFQSTNAPGLGYARGAYLTPDTTTKALSRKTELVVSAVIERQGQVLLLDDGFGGLALPEAQVCTDGASAALSKLISETGLTVSPSFVYSVFEDTHRLRQTIAFRCDAGPGEPTLGSFVPLSSDALDDVTDPASVTMLERRARENAVGTIGIYVGNQKSGDTRVTT